MSGTHDFISVSKPFDLSYCHQNMTYLRNYLFIGDSTAGSIEKSETFLQMKILSNSIAIEYSALNIVLLFSVAQIISTYFYPFKDSGN